MKLALTSRRQEKLHPIEKLHVIDGVDQDLLITPQKSSG